MLCHRASHLLTPLLQRSSSIVTSTTLCSCLATSPPRRYLKFKSRSDPTKDPNYQATREKKLAQAQLAADREKIGQATIQKIIHSRAPRIKNWKRQEIKYDEQGFPLPTPLPFTEAPIDFDTDLDHMKQRRTEERERSSLRRRILADKGIRRDTMKFINQVLAEKTERLGYDPVQLEYNRMKEKQITTEDEIRGIFNKESDMDLAKLIALDTHDVGRMRRLARARRLEVRNEKQKARDERDTVIAYEYSNGTDAAKAFKLTMEKFDKLGKKVFDWWPQTGGTRKQMKATGFMDIRAIILHWKDMEKMAHHLNRKFIYKEKHESDLKSFGEPDMQPKIPVISILGHKDHGKTTLLDQFRGTNVAATEEGQMTQQTYCYQVKLHESSNLTFPCSFIDTPGHANFADMRANGAFFADLVLLVVAADEGVLKQTEESLSYAKQFDVPVVVVINKIDVENANVARVRQQLIDTGVTIVDNKSDTLPPKGSVHVVEISALNRTNLDELITVIFKLQNQLNKQCDLNAIPRGEMLEGFREEGGRNNVLRIILRQGTLRLGQYFVCGFGCGKVLSIKNQYGERVDKAYPGVAVEVHKINILPNPGNDFFVCSEEGARRVVAARLAELHYHDQPRFTQSQQDAQLTRELEYQQQLYHELKRSIKQKEAEKKQAEYDNEKQWQEYMRQENIKKAKIERGEDVEEDENEEMDEEEEDEMEEQDIKANETDTKPKLTASARRAAKRARARERAAMGPIYPVIDYTKPRNIVIKTDSIGSLRMFEESINALNLALKKEMITVAYSHAGRVSNFDLQQAILGEADHIYVFRLPAASKEIQQSAREKGITIKPFRLFEQLLQDIHPAFDPAIFEFVHPHIDQHHDVMKEIQPPTPQEKYHKMKQEIEEMKQRQRQKQEDEDEDDEFEHEDEVEDEDEMEDMESEPAPRQRRGSFFANHTTTRDAHVISSTTHTPESPSESPTQRVSTSRRRF